MTTSSAKRFYLWFALAALIVAGFVSYFASSHPDGLDSATLRGCEVVQTDDGAEILTGSCIAQSETDHTMTGSPLADYTVGGRDGLTGVAGVIGVSATFALAGGAFWLIARARKPAASRED
ncbi:PDGLE domain-containing protein [Rhodococcus sp. H36-A4]|uniref:PDGLE domain-containing protein n=1 Tax=Rhodococcus sp. H36-A4 TaxID=3004353 RepID=UPI0022AEB15D|nr:PDGLE domain-containing protein [Rhodococcus sp. H36-A4]MCZ4077128.1 PDGLE domain-containing protein [Rhodococcus sp. H36-A4]